MKLGAVIKHRKGFILIDDEIEYKLCRVQVNRKGVVLREMVRGEKIKTKKQQVCKSGDFIVAEMDAKVGGYGFVPKELDGAIVSSHYFLFEIDKEQINADFLNILSKHGFFQEQIKAVGSTNYAAIRPRDVLNWDIELPRLKRQEEIVAYLHRIEELKSEVLDELNIQRSLLTSLRQSILTEAVQGHLTAQWRKENPNQEHATELLKRIAAEKAQLIKEKKISKEKPLPAIKEEEVPYALPEGWVWCRLGEVLLQFLGGFAYESNRFIERSKNQVLRLGNVKNNEIRLRANPVFINDDYAEKTSQYRLTEGNILITMTGTKEKQDYCFTTTVRHEDMENINLFLNQRVGCLKFFKEILPDYINTILKNNKILEPIFKKATGSANQANIGKEAILSCLIPIPLLNEQHAIVQKVNTLLACCDELEQQVKQSKADLDLLMQSVLSGIFGTDNQAIGSKPNKTNLSGNETLIPTDVVQTTYEGNTLNMELLEILQQQGGKIAAINLWKMSKYQKDIDAFYEALKKEVEQNKTIKESSEKGWLELVAP